MRDGCAPARERGHERDGAGGAVPAQQTAQQTARNSGRTNQNGISGFLLLTTAPRGDCRPKRGVRWENAGCPPQRGTAARQIWRAKQKQERAEREILAGKYGDGGKLAGFVGWTRTFD